MRETNWPAHAQARSFSRARVRARRGGGAADAARNSSRSGVDSDAGAGGGGDPPFRSVARALLLAPHAGGGPATDSARAAGAGDPMEEDEALVAADGRLGVQRDDAPPIWLARPPSAPRRFRRQLRRTRDRRRLAVARPQTATARHRRSENGTRVGVGRPPPSLRTPSRQPSRWPRPARESRRDRRRLRAGGAAPDARRGGGKSGAPGDGGGDGGGGGGDDDDDDDDGGDAWRWAALAEHPLLADAELLLVDFDFIRDRFPSRFVFEWSPGAMSADYASVRSASGLPPARRGRGGAAARSHSPAERAPPPPPPHALVREVLDMLVWCGDGIDPELSAAQTTAAMDCYGRGTTRL